MDEVFQNYYSVFPGAGLLAHPGEDAQSSIIVVSAPRCTLLRATEELGLCKTYHTGEMEAFSYNDRDNFRNSSKLIILLRNPYIIFIFMRQHIHAFVRMCDRQHGGVSDSVRAGVHRKIRA